MLTVEGIQNVDSYIKFASGISVFCNLRKIQIINNRTNTLLIIYRMKKPFISSLLLGAALLPALSAWSAAPGNRVFYGFNLGSAEWADGEKTYDCGFVSYPFDLSERGTVLKSYLPTPNVGVFAGAGIEGIIYACEYIYSSSSSQPEPSDFVAYNTFNGTIERIGKWNPEGTSFKPSDMTYSVADGKLYAIGYENGSGLYEVNPETGEFTLICNLTSGGTLAADGKGQLYSIDSGGTLYMIDKERGRMNKLWHTGLTGMMSMQSMEFDLTTGLLYWASSTSSHREGAENTWMQEIDLSDPNNIKMTEIDRVGSQSRLVAMHIPYAENPKAPAAPTEISSKPSEDGSLVSTIYWTNPTTAFNGGDLGNLYGCLITRNGEQVAYLTDVKPGEKMEWTDDKIPVQGDYRYDIQLVNGNGNGAKGTAFQYAGNDKPEAVSNINGVISDDFSGLTLSWDAPVRGAHLGSFDPSSVTYRVVRNDNTVVADNLTEPKVTDSKFARVLNYSYTIYAVNAIGETGAESPSFIIGPAIELPLDQTFENAAQVANRWTAIDANNDTYSWMFGTDLGHGVFGDYEMCAEYISSPTLGNAEAADEWLISPPLHFEAGEEYYLAVSARSYSTLDGNQTDDEVIDVHVGNKNTIDAMGDKLDTLLVNANGNDEYTNTMAFKEQVVKLPVEDKDCVRCVGLHLVSPFMASGYIQINSIYVGDKSGINAVDGVMATDVEWTLNGKSLFINGLFKSAALYNAAGMKVANVNGALTDLSGLASGIYLLTIDGKTSKIVIR